MAVTKFAHHILGNVSRHLRVAYRFSYSTMSASDDEYLGAMVRAIIPPLSFSQYKGQCGRIGVVGGCKEYTGAPYFAAISLLKVGADLSHVFCTEGAAPVIKSYSPELIVHPILDKSDATDELKEWIQKMHALVIGPGLGRDPKLFENVKVVLNEATERDLPLVIDADGVYFLTLDPSLIQNYTRAILTPNAPEFKRLYSAVMGEEPPTGDAQQSTKDLSLALGNVTIVRKGPEDIISNGEHVLIGNAEGSPRRCGGQGDLLSGSMGVFAHWAHNALNQTSNQELQVYGPTMAAAYAASTLTRECSRQAFFHHGRSMTTSDMIDKIHHSFERLFSD
ncbi:hypothetical protein CAPTEDRAFT_173289 [Capitella teleta]|uniref:ATP-dependent (S)-NAD(P)H-hydrate dehydratase n=1 Tax=Capitella teleta TaxID=283909 RepID=R7UNW2_CAPTE|nr:hypothetical protein CAPTEDRAFT_173289 [Capitella teleta]|eukprot:ELU08229.1 hypothetical protein CAPTEDRAFT_173289 [Capitella teleta]